MPRELTRKKEKNQTIFDWSLGFPDSCQIKWSVILTTNLVYNNKAISAKLLE